jgi:hypothetical protein
VTEARRNVAASVHARLLAWAQERREDFSPEPVFLRWKDMEASPEGDFYVRSGPGSVRLAADSVREYIRTRFSAGTV